MPYYSFFISINHKIEKMKLYIPAVIILLLLVSNTAILLADLISNKADGWQSGSEESFNTVLCRYNRSNG
jgi:hypothetical protein